MAQSEKLMKKSEVAEQLGMSIRFVEEAVAKLALPHYRIGRCIRFKQSEVEQWLQQRRA